MRFLNFATSGEAIWAGNFRDLNAAVTRMATLAGGGRITVALVSEEIDRLRRSWVPAAQDNQSEAALEEYLSREQLDAIDPFDRVQLNEVVRTCQSARTLSEAGRTLFSVSRQRKGSSNDADRLRKYLARYGLDWQHLSGSRRP